MPMILGYWNVRGLTQPIRMLLEYTDSSYEEKKYTMGDAPDYEQSQWLSDKFKLGLDFPNLPYLIDGPHKITQSNAIIRYIARKNNLCGETEEERIRADIVENQVMDNRMQLIRLCYNPDFVAVPLHSSGRPTCLLGSLSLRVVTAFLKTIPEKIKLYSEFLGKRPWCAGNKITYVDFLVYDILDQHRIFQPHCLDAFPNLNDFMVRFEGLKKISDYMKSSRFIYKPFYVKLAFWNPK
uniref:Glutathione S-transferase Mu 4 n=1 Tax=Peromyscus maniculatus bairdii TaxID=230844 RepID=A0A8C8TNG9_PERMB